MTTDAVGGVWTYALDLARGLAAKGVRTTLAVIGPKPRPDQAARAAAIQGLRLIETDLALDWTASAHGELSRAAKAVADHANRSGAEAVHLNSPALASEARFEAPVVGACHSCLATWWSAVRGGDPPTDFLWRIEATARGYAACDELIAPTAAFSQATAEIYGQRPRVVWNGREAPRPAPVSKSGDLVFTAGRLWDPGKQVELLDRVASRLPSPVFAAGPTMSPTGQRIGLEALHTLGELDDAGMHYWLSRARTFVSLAAYEPFGLAVLEAAQAGCALLLSENPTFRELWGGAALFVPTADEDAASAALRRLLSDDQAAEQLGEAARVRAATYTIEAMTNGALDAYVAAATGRASKAAVRGAAA